jgi:hypothetical protein
MLINHSDAVEEVNTHMHPYTSIDRAMHIIMNKKNFKCDDEDDHRSLLLFFYFYLMLIGMFLFS